MTNWQIKDITLKPVLVLNALSSQSRLNNSHILDCVGVIDSHL